MTDFAPPANIQEEVMTFLSSRTLQQIIAFRASDNAQQRLRYLLNANRNDTLTPEEEAELEEASNVNQFMTSLAHKKVS